MAIVYGKNISNLIGSGTGATSGDDDIFGWDQTNGAGNYGPVADSDTLSGLEGNDGLYGGGGNDTLDGGTGFDDLAGGAGDDRLVGGADADVLAGGAGVDTLVSGSDAGDFLVGGAGADRIETNGASFNLVTFEIAGAGTFLGYGDILSYHTSTAAIRYAGGALSGGDAQGDVVVGAISAIVGSAGNDTIKGFSGYYAYGLAGNDTITGGGFVSNLYGGSGDDSLQGFGGADLFGGLGNDTLRGDAAPFSFGTGVEYSATAAGVRVDLAITGVQNTGAEGRDVLVDILHLTGGSGDDRLRGNAGGNRINGAAGDDSLFGAAGDDTLSGGLGADTVDGGAGVNRVTFQSAVTLDLNMASLNAGEAAGDTFVNIQRFDVQNGASILRGNAGGNAFYTAYGTDRLVGNGGNDGLFASGGIDSLFGGAGNDTLDGGSDADVMTGGAGDDVLMADVVSDTIDEVANGGTDTLQTGIATVVLGVTCGSANVENVVHTGGFGPFTARVTGTAGANAISFQYAFDDSQAWFSGAAGNDTLTGAAGADSLTGGRGLDRLTGGMGRDTLIGDTGADRFVFANNGDSGTTATTRDLIRDFVRGSDRIELSLIDPYGGSFVAGDQAFQFIGGAAFDGNTTDVLRRGEVRFVQINVAGTVNDKTIVYGALNGSTATVFAIELTGLHMLSAADFVL